MAKNATLSDQAKKIWSSNLVQFGKVKTSRTHSTVKNLSQMHKMPTEQQILDRYKTLAAHTKSKNKRIVMIADEVRKLWKKLNLPVQKVKSTIKRKVENLIKKA